MARHLSVFFALLLVSPFAWSQILDHESSSTVELDKATGMWALECELEVDGINAFEDHRINAVVQYGVAGDGSAATTIAASYFDIFGNERSKSELTAGVFAFEAKKMGDRLTIGISLSWPAAGASSGEGFNCGINVTKLEGGVPGQTIGRMHVTNSVYSY